MFDDTADQTSYDVLSYMRASVTITFRGEEKKQRVVKSVKMLGLDNPEILRRSANHYYGRYQGEFKAYDLLRKRLDVLPESGR